MGLKEEYERLQKIKQGGDNNAVRSALTESPRETLKKGPTLPARNTSYQTQVVLKPPASTPLKPPTRVPTTMSGRLAAGGMNLTFEEKTAVREKEAETARRFGLGASSVGHGLVGSLPAVGETFQQDYRNAKASKENWDAILASNAEYQRLISVRGSLSRDVKAGKYGTTDEAAKARGYGSAEELNTLIERAKGARDSEYVNTPVDQTLFGQRMMAKSRELQAEATEGLGGADAFLANQAISMGRMLPGLAVGALNPAAGLTVMGAQAMADKTSTLNEQGAAPGEALRRGFVSGAIEFATEKLPLDNLLGIIKGSGGRTFVKNLLRQSGIEATEESVSYVANYAADLAAKDPEAKFSWAELLESALGGALSGGVLSSAGTAVGGALNSRANQQGRLPNMDENGMVRPQTGKLPNMIDQQKVEQATPSVEQIRTPEVASDAGSLVNPVMPQDAQTVNSQPAQEAAKVAEPYLPAPQQVQNVQRMQETAAQLNIPQETMDSVSAIAGKFNVPVEFVDTLGDKVNGKYENGKITIAKDTKNPVMAVFTHELTHHIESSGQYEQLAGLVKGYIEGNGADFNTLVQKQKEVYGKAGIQLDDAGASQEVVARFLESRGLFEDEAFVNRLTRENPTLAQRILDWIKDTIRKVGADTDTRFLIDAQRLYERATREDAGGRESSGKSQLSVGEEFRPDANRSYRFYGKPNPMSEWGHAMFADNPDTNEGYGKYVFSVDHSKLVDTETLMPEIVEKLNEDYETGMLPPDLERLFDDGLTAEEISAAFAPEDIVMSAGAYDNSEFGQWFFDRVAEPAGILGVKTPDGAIVFDEQVIEKEYAAARSLKGNNEKYSRSDEMSDFMQQYLEQHGAIPKGEKAARDVQVPSKTSDRTKTRRFTRTMMESEAIPDSMIGNFEEAIVNGTFAYVPMSDKAALSHAERVIRDDGFEGALKRWEAVTNGKATATKNDIVLGEMLLNQAANAGDVELAMNLAAELAAEGTRAGQSVQALRLLKRMKPDGQLYYLQKSVQKVNADLLKKLKIKAPNVKIDEALAGELLKATNQREIDVATDKIMQNIADQIPPSWADKWNAWRYLSMLGNPRTHVRNLIGNAVFMPAVNLKNLIAAPMEKTIPKDQRTKAVLTGKDKGLKNFAKADFENVRVEITGGGKLNPSDAIRDKQTIFKTKLLEVARKANLNALEAEDALFLKRHYISSMAQVMKARGYTADFLKSETKEGNAALEEARNYAIEEAKKATYRDASALASAINNFKRSGPAAAIIGEGLMPFTKTPINIAKRGMEYSPIGLINGTKSAMVDVRKGTKTASQAIDQFASGLSGTGIMLLGMWLASLDLLSGGASDDKKESLFDRLQGLQNYALKIGDYTYTLDWAAPSSLPLFVGVELHNMVTSGGKGAEKSLAAILDSLTKIGGPMIDMSMLQGIDNLFRSTSYGNHPLPDAIVETVVGYFGQGVPTLLGQVARTIDGTRRSRFIDKNSGVPEFAQKFIQTQQAKIPFASKALTPHVDAWGRTQENGGVVGRAVQNFLSPGYVSKGKTGDVDEELMRLYSATGESSVLPSNAAKYIRFDDQTKRFTAEEYFTYASEMGQASFQNIKDLLGLPYYARMTDEEKVATISALYSYSGAVAKTKVSDYELKDHALKAHEAEKQGIKPSVYFSAYTAQKDVEGDSDGSGGTISGTSTVNKRKAIDKALPGVSFKQRDVLYKAMGAGLSDAMEKKWTAPSVQKAVGSREKYYQVQGLISTIQADKDEFGNSISGTAKSKEIDAIAKQLGVSQEKAKSIYNELVVFKHSISEMSSQEQRDWQTFKTLNMSESKYIKYNNEMRIVSGLKDARGKTISGSLKRNRYNRLVQLGMSPAQARHFLNVRYGYKW